MSNKFAIGTHVRLSEEFKRWYRDTPMNPYTEVGIVIESAIGGSVCVEWSGGGSSYYKPQDLEVAEYVRLNADSEGVVYITAGPNSSISATNTICTDRTTSATKSVEMSTKGGIKHDSGKPDLSLCPPVALREMAYAFMHGEKKYSRHNYKKGFESHRLIASAMRHLDAYRDGEDLDLESTTGSSHLGHALASIAMLLECERLGTLIDTRYKHDSDTSAD